MRVTVLTQYYPPEMGAPQARLSELGERLIESHWQVECLTALPNYPTGRVFPGYDPSKPVVEKVGRIRTVRVPLYPANQGFIRRIQCYLSFAFSAIRFGPKLCQQPDLLFVESPPLFIGIAARRLSRIWRCPFVLNVSDLWPESAIRMGIVKPGLLTTFAEKLELSLYRHAAGVTGQSAEIIKSIRERSCHTPIEVITNGVEPSRFGKERADEGARSALGAEAGPVFIYAGLLGLAQGLDQILDLAKSLREDMPGRIVLVGEGPVRDHLAGRIRAERIIRVKLLPAVDRQRIPALLGAADAAIISLGMKLPGAVPSKIYEAMASSLPVLLIAHGEAADRVRDAQCGFVVTPGDLTQLRSAFERLASDEPLRQRLGAQGRKAAETTYNRCHIATRLEAFFRQCLRARIRSSGGLNLAVP
jgi:glycosyltransferase involved in cell wall biosynthesis